MRLVEIPTAAVLAATLAGCGLSGAPVPECKGSGSGDRAVAIVRPPAQTPEERPVAIECWRGLDPERIELWFDYPAGSGCWQLSSLELRESADAISIALAATPAAVCVDDAGAGVLTQIELQAPVEERAVLDASSA
jgi:hypothetical protein